MAAMSEGKKKVKNPDAEHVRTLWRMDRDKRVRVWRNLEPFDKLEVLELGGEFEGIKCPLEPDELSLLLPNGSHPLADVHELRLYHGMSEWGGGEWLCSLADAGCGANLTSLTLWGELFPLARNSRPRGFFFSFTL